MLRIRLARTGKKKQASYRVVVADQRRAVQAKFVEILGWYNPHTKELQVNKEKTEGWLGKGANPTNSVAKLLKKDGLKLPEWVEIKEKKKESKSKGKEEAKVEAPKAAEEAEASEKIEGDAEVAVEEGKEAEEPKEESTEESVEPEEKE